MVAALSSLNVFSLSGTQRRMSLIKDKIKDLEAMRRWLWRIASAIGVLLIYFGSASGWRVGASTPRCLVVPSVTLVTGGRISPVCGAERFLGGGA